MKKEIKLFCKAMKTMRKVRLLKEMRRALNPGEFINNKSLEGTLLFHSTLEDKILSDEERDLFLKTL